MAFIFRCGNFENEQFVYAIKSQGNDWHYFEPQDSFIDAHNSLKADLSSRISLSKSLHSIAVKLMPDQLINYVSDGKFMFKGKELKTCKLYLNQLNRLSGT